MNIKKAFFLFLALILPIGIFIFLKVFGKNEFDVPLIYAEGIIDKPANCTYKYPSPYVLPDSIMQRWNGDANTKLFIISTENMQALSVLASGFGKEVSLKSLSSLSYTKEQKQELVTCVLLLQSPNNIVLIDDQKRVRGYYNGNDRDELDRLEVEMKIILKQY